MLADECEVLPSELVRTRAVDVDVDDQQIVRLAEVVPESCHACGHRRLGRIAAGKEVGDGLASETVFDLDGRADLGELKRGTGGGDVHERPIDRTEIALGREEQMADDLAADPDRDRDRLGVTSASAPAPRSTRRRQSSPPSGDAPAMTRRM